MFFKDAHDPFVENKQRLNLSRHAYTVLLSDMEAFYLSDKVGNVEVSSGVINQVFCRFYEQANASITIRLKYKEAEWHSMLSSVEPYEVREAIVQNLKEHYKTRLLEELELRKEKGLIFSVRLDKQCRKCLASGEVQELSIYYKEKVGRYLKAVIEEYASKPYIERERIWYRDTVQEIREALEDRAMLKLTLRTGNILYIKPQGIQQDTERLYNYLYGFGSSQSKGPWQVMSVRLSSIVECRCMSQSGYLDATEKTEIEKAIQKNGVQYLSSHNSTERIVVEFTEKGEQMYRRLLHLRPVYISRKNRIYEFECTRFQAESYFFKFGCDVKILEPQALVELFSKKYEEAAAIYRISE